MLSHKELCSADLSVFISPFNKLIIDRKDFNISGLKRKQKLNDRVKELRINFWKNRQSNCETKTQRAVKSASVSIFVINVKSVSLNYSFAK